MTNYGRKLQMRADIRRKEKVETATEFVERMTKVQKEIRAALKRAQEKMKQQANKEQKEVEV